MAQLSIIGHQRSHDALRRVLGARQPCKILDVPAGRGVFAAFLREKGWEVHAADIDPGNFQLNDMPFSRVNLNKALPFDDASFDAVCCVNGLHRLVLPENAIREFFRILKPGGHLYINVNNYSSMLKRLKFLLTGSIDQAIDSQICIQTISDPEANVRLPLMYPRLHSILNRTGFSILDVQPAAVRHRDRLVAPLALLLYGLNRFVPRRQREQLHLSEGNHRAVLSGGAYLFIDAVKTDSGELKSLPQNVRRRS